MGNDARGRVCVLRVSASLWRSCPKAVSKLESSSRTISEHNATEILLRFAVESIIALEREHLGRLVLCVPWEGFIFKMFASSLLLETVSVTEGGKEVKGMRTETSHSF